MTDAELLRSLRSDGPERELAIVQLRELLMRGVSKSLNGRYGKPISVDDVVQDALVKILRTLDQFQGKSEFRTWAMAIAIRVGISQLRRRYHADQSLDAFRADKSGKFELMVAELHTPALSHARGEMLELLQELIDRQLTDKQRIVIRSYLSGFSTDGTASALGSNRNAVYKLLHDARMQLKDGLAAAGYGSEDVLALLAAETERS